MLIPRSTMQARVIFLCTFSAALATFHSPSHALNALFHRLIKVGAQSFLSSCVTYRKGKIRFLNDLSGLSRLQSFERGPCYF